MFGRDIQRIMEDMERAMKATGNLEVTPRDYDGHRVEVVNGEVTEEYLVDGEWVDKQEALNRQSDDSDGGNVFDLMDGTFTIDLSSEITGNRAVADASINNGVLTVEFEALTEDPDDE